MANKIHILGFAGSLREGSYNKSLIRNAIALAPDSMAIEFYDLEGLPFYNADVEAEGDPGPVVDFKHAINRADGLLIASPEYNYGVTGITKNAVDWASRPPKDAPLKQKPVGILGASPSSTGTARSQSQLRQALVGTHSYCMVQPQILVSRAHEKFDDEGNLTDETTRKYLKNYLEALYEWVIRFRQEDRQD